MTGTSGETTRTWLTFDQLNDLLPGAEVRLLAKCRVVFRKNATGTWDELPQSESATLISERQNVPSQTLYYFGVQDVV